MSPATGDSAARAQVLAGLHPLLARLVTATGAAVLDSYNFDAWAVMARLAQRPPTVIGPGQLSGISAGSCSGTVDRSAVTREVACPTRPSARPPERPVPKAAAALRRPTSLADTNLRSTA
jgi:hypothetical protein